MKDLLQKYLKLLKIELEDVEEDLSVLLELHEQRKQRGEITNYVFLENVAVLKKGILGIRNFLQSVDILDAGKYSSLTEMIEDIDNLFKQKTKDYNFPEAIYTLTERKFNKIAKYILSSES